MPPSPLPPDAFPAWARLHGAAVAGVELRHLDAKGCGFVARGETGQAPLLAVARDLVLSAEAVRGFAKVDARFAQLLDAVGPKSARLHAMLYLLCHLVRARRGRGVAATPWTEYLRFLPLSVPTPTMWSEPERLLLRGTSLEASLQAKLEALAGEFDELRARTEAMPFWNDLLWEEGTASVHDWILVDAWYRSRTLELPDVGDAMVPAVDMVNHSSSPTAYYDAAGGSDVLLLARSGRAAACGSEVTISYGEGKSAAEMLFSYGFIDRDDAAPSLTLPLDPFPDDPLAKAKAHVFGHARTVRLTRRDGRIEWESPFVYLMCLNEEDGLEFRLLQDTRGERQLRLSWQGDDVTDQTSDFETLVQGHDLRQVFRLRAVAVVHERVEAQLARVQAGPCADQPEPSMAAKPVREECVASATTLREMESRLLEAAAEALATEKRALLADGHVAAHLVSVVEAPSDATPMESTPNDDQDDFS